MIEMVCSLAGHTSCLAWARMQLLTLLRVNCSVLQYRIILNHAGIERDFFPRALCEKWGENQLNLLGKLVTKMYLLSCARIWSSPDCGARAQAAAKKEDG